MSNSYRKEEIRDALSELETESGRLTPEEVVRHAADSSSPLHAYFEWDDSVAAHAHRISQARDLISSVRVEVKTTTTTVKVVGYVRDPSVHPSQQGYVNTLRLKSEADLARDAVVDAFANASGHLRRARQLASALEVQEDVDDLVRRVEVVKGKAESYQSQVAH